MKSLPLYNPTYLQLCEDFNKALMTKGYSRGKPSIYPNYVREFLCFLERKGIQDIRQVKAIHVMDYHHHISTRPNTRRGGLLSQSVIDAQHFSLRLFFDHLMDTGIITATPVNLPKFKIRHYKQRAVFTEEEMAQLYQQCETGRDRALLSLAYGCGLRKSEIEKLNLPDVSLSEGSLIVRDGKNSKRRTIPLSDKVLGDLRHYIIYERSVLHPPSNPSVNPQLNPHGNPSVTPALLLNNWGTRMRGLSMNTRLKQLIRNTKNPAMINKGVTLHGLRHSITTHLLDNGASIEFVQDFLGHANPDTAHIYARRRKQRLMIQSMAEQALAR